jgi:hypothetical protein
MAQIPANQTLWNMLVAQAKTRFRVYPSIAASTWVHQQYVKDGGQFVDSAKKLSRKDKATRKKTTDDKKKQSGKK